LRLNTVSGWRRMRGMEEHTQIAAPQWPAAVVMERQSVDSRWATEKWEAKGVVPDLTPEAAPKVIVDTPERTQILFSGLTVRLHKDEADGYAMNITSVQPKVFVLWREDEGGVRPEMLTVSYYEGSRWMDSGEHVDGVPLPTEWVATLAEFARAYHRPEERKKPKYATNRDKGRMGNWRPD